MLAKRRTTWALKAAHEDLPEMAGVGQLVECSGQNDGVSGPGDAARDVRVFKSPETLQMRRTLKFGRRRADDVGAPRRRESRRRGREQGTLKREGMGWREMPDRRSAWMVR